MSEPADKSRTNLLDDAVAGGKSILSGAKGFLAWLATSIAGISALLYGFGFLVTRAHLNMLGLYGFVDYGPDAYLQEGARFFLVITYRLLRGSAVPLLALLGVIVALVFTLQPLLVGTRMITWCRRLIDAVCGSIFRIGVRLSISESNLRELLRRCVFIMLLAAGLQSAGDALDASVGALCISNLLYPNPGVAQCSSALRDTASAMQTEILAADGAALDRSFYDIFFHVVYLIFATFIAWRVAQPWRNRGWFISPLVACVLLLVILLPMSYGILQRPISYPRVVVAPPHVGTSIDKLYLVGKNSGEFVLWDGSAKQLLWVPTGGLTSAEIMDVENLFGHTAVAPADKGGAK